MHTWGRGLSVFGGGCFGASGPFGVLVALFDGSSAPVLGKNDERTIAYLTISLTRAR